MTDIISRALNEYAASSNRVFETDRMNTVGASEIGQCIRKIFWIKNELDPVYGVVRDNDYVESWGARARGTIFENFFWEPALRVRFGDRLKFAGKNQRTFIDNFLSATPDGLVTELTASEKKELGTDADCIMAECKTADPRSNLTDPKATNTYQVQVQMGLVREQTPFKPTHSLLSYTDASFWSEVKEFVIPFEPKLYDIAKDRAALIMTATSIEALKPEGWIAGGSECKYCPFTRACGIQRRNLPFADAPVDPQFVAEITDMALELKAAEVDRDESDNLVRELQDAIKTRLREKGVKKIPGVVSWSPVKGRAGYDTAALKVVASAAGIDITQFEKEGEPGDRLTIQIGSPKAA
ncbi:hypothetical protein [Bradyrhizobium elkanii]|uniref:hypothetical protein n=1 Tax=Bradyrhizobium elkanii TaxID=29448 RepID=UPI0004AFCD17|nr:hypothetical protein [Bradyrhizobium elkanii]WLA79600.1 hypothetical protein QNJ99_29915 [Bradyrhizobium elkanii]